MCFFVDVSVTTVDELDATEEELITRDEVDVVEEVTAPVIDE